MKNNLLIKFLVFLLINFYLLSNSNANNKIVDTEGYPDPGELLYDHSADEVFYPKDPDEIDENLNERINMGNQEFDFRIFDEIEPGDKFTVFDAEGNYVDVTLVKHSNQKNANAWSHNVNDIEIKLPDGKIKRLNNSTFAITSNTRHRDYKIQGIGSFMNKEYRNTPLSSIDPGIKISLRSAARQQAKKLLGGKVLNDAGNKIQAVRYISDYHALTYDLEMRHQKKFSENFADGKKKGKSRPGRVKRSGASCKGSVTSLRAKAKKYSGERGKMYHWCANMKGGKKKKNESLLVSTFDTEFVQKAKELYNAGQQGQLVRHIYKFSKDNSEKLQARPDLKQMLQDIFYEVSDNFQDEDQIEELLFIIDDTLNKNVNESAFKNLKLPTWIMHPSLEKLFAQEYGPRYGDYVAHMDLDSDTLELSPGGEIGDMAFELAKVNDIKVMKNFLSQMPVQFTVDDLELVDGIQKWHLVQQNKTVH